MNKPIEYNNWYTGHLILYSKGHYKKTDNIINDLRTMFVNATGTPEQYYSEIHIYDFVCDAFVESSNKYYIREILKCFYRKPYFLGDGQATLKEMIENMIGMMACIQVYEDDKDGNKIELVKLGEPNPEYLPIPKENEPAIDNV